MNPLHVRETRAEMTAEEGWIGVGEVAAYFRVARGSVYKWVESEGFPARRVGRLLRFKLSEVDKWVKNSGGEGSSSDSAASASTTLPAPSAARQAGKVRTKRPRKKEAKKDKGE